ncbi:MAG: phytanoyl-CoA dioxygenase [Methylomarinum sp.]|nr:phytanoyl-CoA dioxygenase [Methylomarinum sp.]
MKSKSLLSDNQRNEFTRNGVLVIKNFYDLEQDILPIQKAIYEIIGLIFKRQNIHIDRAEFSPENFDAGFQQLIALDRTFGSEIYDAVKQIPSFVRLLTHSLHEELLLELRTGAFPAIAAGGYGIRIDNPNEDQFRANWHQEYPAQLRSLDGLVYWSSLVTMTELMGPVEFCLGSHREGPVPVFTQNSKTADKTGAYSLVLKNEEVLLEKYTHIAPLTEPGDLVIIDFLVLHASGLNRSLRARWSMQFRYFNFNEPAGLANGWKGSYAAGVDFKKVHPELCVDKGEE